jgi:hypothetical protein
MQVRTCQENGIEKQPAGRYFGVGTSQLSAEEDLSRPPLSFPCRSLETARATASVVPLAPCLLAALTPPEHEVSLVDMFFGDLVNLRLRRRCRRQNRSHAVRYHRLPLAEFVQRVIVSALRLSERR